MTLMTYLAHHVPDLETSLELEIHHEAVLWTNKLCIEDVGGNDGTCLCYNWPRGAYVFRLADISGESASVVESFLSVCHNSWPLYVLPLFVVFAGPHSGCTASSVVPGGLWSEYALSPTLWLSLSWSLIEDIYYVCAAFPVVLGCAGNYV